MPCYRLCTCARPTVGLAASACPSSADLFISRADAMAAAAAGPCTVNGRGREGAGSRGTQVAQALHPQDLLPDKDQGLVVPDCISKPAIAVQRRSQSLLPHHLPVVSIASNNCRR